MENDAEFQKLFNDFTASGSRAGKLSLAEEGSGSSGDDGSPAENGITARARGEAATRILRQLLDLIYADDSPFVEILCGHLHFSWQGMVSPHVHQTVFSPAFSRYMGVIRVSG